MLEISGPGSSLFESTCMYKNVCRFGVCRVELRVNMKLLPVSTVLFYVSRRRNSILCFQF